MALILAPMLRDLTAQSPVPPGSIQSLGSLIHMAQTPSQPNREQQENEVEWPKVTLCKYYWGHSSEHKAWTRRALGTHLL